MRQSDDSGVASIILVLSTVLLLGAVAISVDVARAVAVTRSAQNGADAVALAMAKDCVARGALSGAGYDRYIRTSSAIGNGQSQSLVGPLTNTCASGSVGVTAKASETMNYSFGKVVGLSNDTLSRKATAKWGQLASGVIFPFAFSTCAFPNSFSSGNATTPGTPLMLYGQGVRTTCPRDGSTTGQSSNSKGFIFDGCVMTSIGGTLTDANGNNLGGTGCQSTDLNFYVGKDVLLPVWGSAVQNSGGSIYTITNLVGFHVLGWSANGSSNSGPPMTGRCAASYPGFTPDPATAGDSNKPCLFGYVTSFSSTTGGTTGQSCGSTGDPFRPACFVYLSD